MKHLKFFKEYANFPQHFKASRTFIVCLVKESQEPTNWMVIVEIREITVQIKVVLGSTVCPTKQTNFVEVEKHMSNN